MFIVFDLDGTLALNQHRNHFIEKGVPDWDSYLAACGDDGVNLPIVEVYHTLLDCCEDGIDVHRVEVWTGRSDAVKNLTNEWFRKNDVPFPDAIRMRPASDYRPDTVLKQEWMDEHGKPDLVFDDRSSVIAMFRSHGVMAAQVAEGNF